MSNKSKDDPEFDSIIEAARRARKQGDTDCALETGRGALAVADENESPQQRMQAINLLAQLARDAGQPEAALSFYEAIAEHFLNQKDLCSQAHAIRHMADIYCEQGRLGEAAAAYARAVGIYREGDAGHSLDLANALRGYALLMDQLQDHDRALVFWRRANELYVECGIEAGIDESRLWIKRYSDN